MNYKTIECKNWNENIKDSCSRGIKCTYAHGKDDLKKRQCLGGIKCYNHLYDHNEKFEHPSNWDPYINKKPCKFTKCKKENCLYFHDKEVENNNIKQDIINDLYKNIDLNEKDFPQLTKFDKKDNVQLENTYSELFKEVTKDDIKELNNKNYEITSNINEKEITFNIEFIDKIKDNSADWDKQSNNNMSFNGDPFEHNNDQKNILQEFLNTIDLFRKTLEKNYNKIENTLIVNDDLKIFIDKENSNLKYNIKYIENIKN